MSAPTLALDPAMTGSRDSTIPRPDRPRRRTGRSAPALDVGIGAASDVLPGRDVPGAAMSNAALSRLMERAAAICRARGLASDFPISSPEFPRDRIGIDTRFVLDAALGSRDLAIEAGRRALAAADVDRQAVRAVIVSTVTPDRVVPALATSVQHNLDLSDAVAAFDVSLGCNGFLSALDVGARLLAGCPDGAAALVIGAETMIRVLDACDRGTCAIFGDGGGAVVLQRGAGARIRPVGYVTQGGGGPRIEIRAEPDAGAPMLRFVARDGVLGVEEDTAGRARVVMDGRAVFRDMVRLLPAAIRDYLAAQRVALAQIDWLACHQANERMIGAIARELGLPGARTLTNIAELGNTTSASIPILLSQARRDGRIRDGQRVLLVGFGTGYSIGMTVVEW